MANTYTNIVAAAALAATGAAGVNATDTTLQAGTGQYLLEVVVTSGAGAGKNVRLYFFVSNVDYTPTAAELAHLATYAHKLDIACKPGLNSVTHRASLPFVPTGTHLYTWVDHDTTPAAATLNVYLTEIPNT